MNDTNNKLPFEYRRLCRYLWERINATNNDDHESLKSLSYITFDLMETIDGQKYSGPMWDLNMWAGLKRDAPNDFKDEGEGIKQDYPEIFQDQDIPSYEPVRRLAFFTCKDKPNPVSTKPIYRRCVAAFV